MRDKDRERVCAVTDFFEVINTVLISVISGSINIVSFMKADNSTGILGSQN